MAEDDKPDAPDEEAQGADAGPAKTPAKKPAKKAARKTAAKSPAQQPPPSPAEEAAAENAVGGVKAPSGQSDDGGETTASPPPADYAAGSEGADDDDDSGDSGLRGDYRSRTDDFRRGAEETAARMRGAAETAQEHTRQQMNSARDTIGESDDRTIAIAVYVLYLAVGVTGGVGALAGAILAWVKKDAQDSVIATHMEFQLRTFWIGLAAFVVGLVLSIIFVGFLILLALAVWWLLRNVVGLIRLLEGKPMPDPKSWLI